MLITFALLACPGCGSSTSSSSEQQAGTTGSIRLADRLSGASIRSPLTEIQARKTLDFTEDMRSQVLFEEDFEEFDLQRAGWPETSEGTVVETDRGRSFRLAGRTRVKRRAWAVPAEPGTHYHFERFVRSLSPLAADFEIVEVHKSMSIDELLAGRGRINSLSRTHWAPPPKPDGTWQHGSVSFFSMPYTRAFLIVVWATPRRLAELDAAQAEGEAWFDDIRLSRLEPSPQQSIAWMKAQDLAENADPEWGIRKRGQFLPLVSQRGARASPEENYSFRYGLYGPPPSELGFPLTLGAQALLRFSYCLSRMTQRGHTARFEVLVESMGKRELLWSESLTALPKQWHWHEAQIDLSAFEGRPIEILLRTSADEDYTHPMWGNPVVELPFLGTGASHVILIAVDTLRADRLSCYGYDRQTSPHIDALAADGVRFDAVVSNATWTCPSFASIFTGVVPSRHGVWASGNLWAQLPAHFQTLAESFRAAGWATQSIAYKAPIYRNGYDQGFDVSFNVPRKLARADDNLAKALEWLDRDSRRRNFLFLHFDDPHQPFGQPAPFDNAFGSLAEGAEWPYSVPLHSLNKEARLSAGDLYDGEVAYVDDRIGAFLDELKRRGLYDDAVIVFVSDHGEELWEHGGFGHDRGKLFDEGVRVPLIVKPAAGAAVPGRVVQTQVRAFDVMPTLLELAGVAVGDNLDAQSLVPLLAGDTSLAPDRLAVTETFNAGLSVRTPQWKYISRYWRDPDSSEALFDLQTDPSERRNVAAEQPVVAARMRLQVLDYLMLHRSGCYMVAIESGSGETCDWLVHGMESPTHLHGIEGRPLEEGRVRFDGMAGGPLAVVSRFVQVAPLHVGDAHSPEQFCVRYRAGDLERLLLAPQKGVHFFGGPSTAKEQLLPLQTMDPRQLEALRAMGYLGDDTESTSLSDPTDK